MSFKDKSNYDDMGYSSPSRRQDRDRMDKRSLRTIVLVVIFGILLCAAVVLLWVFYFSGEGEKEGPPRGEVQPSESPEVATVALPKEEVEIRTPQPVAQLSSSAPTGWYREYLVQEGDTLESISAEFGISRETILSVNQIKSIQEVSSGKTLLIPVSNGQLYTVQSGDSLSIITSRFNPTLGWKTLQEINNLPSEQIRPGQKIFIPSPQTAVNGYFTRFIKPAEGRIGGSYNQAVLYGKESKIVTLKGILIEGKLRDAVKASNSGLVADVGNDVDGEGRFIVLSHDQGYKTTYTHLDEVLVKVGEQVKQGDVIGLLGESGAVEQPTLYFQIDQEGTPLDPANFF